VLPAATSLKKQGANKGATTAFLISTPESGIDSIAITYALLDPIMTVIRPLAAFLTAVTAGFIENIMNWPKKVPSKNDNFIFPVAQCAEGTDSASEVNVKPQSIFAKIKAGISYAINDVWGDIVFWFFSGLLLAGVITAIIPDEVLTTWLGGGLSSMLVMLVVGIPLYICATASTPIAAALILKGVSPGAALVFLLVGPATNVTSLSVLFGILGKMSTIRYLFVLAASAVLFGLSVDALYSFLDIAPQAIIGDAAEVVPYGIKLLASIFLILISIKPAIEWIKKRQKPQPLKQSFESDFPKFS
jgi:uncharacterized membrane protein YraQ (UPF0718 family)